MHCQNKTQSGILAMCIARSTNNHWFGEFDCKGESCSSVNHKEVLVLQNCLLWGFRLRRFDICIQTKTKISKRKYYCKRIDCF